jgi:putative hydrolase of the HAD superfamily
MLRAVLFDLDDTLAERAATLAEYVPCFVRDFAAQLQTSDAAVVAAELARVDRNGYNPQRAADLAALALWSTSPGARRLNEHWREHFVACTRGRAGLREVFDALVAAGLRTGVVTNGPTAGQRRKLELLGLRDRIGALAISEELGVAKPDPRIFHAALAQLAVEPGECVFIGDNPEKDVLAAQALGMRAIWLRGELPWPAGTAPARESIATLRELLPLLGLAHDA